MMLFPLFLGFWKLAGWQEVHALPTESLTLCSCWTLCPDASFLFILVLKFRFFLKLLLLPQLQPPVLAF